MQMKMRRAVEMQRIVQCAMRNLENIAHDGSYRNLKNLVEY